MQILSRILTFGSIIPLAFLIYTIANLEKLGIKITHPRVLVEAILFVLLLVSGLILWHKT